MLCGEAPCSRHRLHCFCPQTENNPERASLCCVTGHRRRRPQRAPGAPGMHTAVSAQAAPRDRSQLCPLFTKQPQMLHTSIFKTESNPVP